MNPKNTIHNSKILNVNVMLPATLPQEPTPCNEALGPSSQRSPPQKKTYTTNGRSRNIAREEASPELEDSIDEEDEEGKSSTRRARKRPKLDLNLPRILRYTELLTDCIDSTDSTVPSLVSESEPSDDDTDCEDGAAKLIKLRLFTTLKALNEYSGRAKKPFFATTKYREGRNKKMRPMFSCFTDAREFITWHKQERARMEGTSCDVRETLRCNKPVKCFVDIDDRVWNEIDYSEEGRNRIGQVIDVIRLHAIELKLKPDDWEPKYVVAIGSRSVQAGVIGKNKYNAGKRYNYKFSAHIIFLDFAARNMPALKEFMKTISNQDESGTFEHLCVDKAVYVVEKKTQSFRCEGTYKFDDDILKVPMARVEELCTKRGRINDADFLVGNPDVSDIVIEKVGKKKAKKKQKPKSKAKTDEDEDKGGQPCDGIVLKTLKASFGAECVVAWDETRKSYYITNDMRNVCPVCDRLHKSNNGYAREDKMGMCWFFCLSPSSDGNRRFLFSKRTLNQKKGENVWKKGTDVHTREPDNNKRIQSFRWNDKLKVMVCVAGMDMGKTFQLQAFLKKHDLKRVLIVTCRIQLAYTLKKIFPEAGLYMKRDKDEDGNVIFKGIDSEWLICQYESLHKINTGLFDCVILDEFRSTCANVTSLKTNGKHLGSNIACLEMYMVGAKYNLILDADAEVDACIPDFLDGFFTPEQIRVERYTKSRMERHFDIHAEIEWLALLKKMIQKGQRCGIPFRTKKSCNVVMKLVKEWMLEAKIDMKAEDTKCEMVPGGIKEMLDSLGITPEEATRVYTSESPDSAMEDFAGDIDFCWSLVFCAGFTAKVTCGADIQRKFATVFIHTAGAGGCCARDIMQMLGRFRNIEDINVKVLLSKNSKPAIGFVDFDGAVEYYRSVRTTLKDCHARFIKFNPEFKDTSRLKTWAPDYITRVFAHARSEHKRDFVCDLLQQASDKGFKVMDLRIMPTPEEAEKHRLEQGVLRAQATETIESRRNRWFDKYRDVYEHEYPAAKKKQDEKDSNLEMSFIVEMHTILSKYLGDMPAETYEEYSVMKKHAIVIDRIAYEMRLNTASNQAVRCEYQRIAFANADKKGLVDLQHFVTQADVSHKCNSLVAKLGFKGVFDTESKVQKAHMILHKDDITGLARDTHKARLKSTKVFVASPQEGHLGPSFDARKEIRESFGMNLKYHEKQIDGDQFPYYKLVDQMVRHMGKGDQFSLRELSKKYAKYIVDMEDASTVTKPPVPEELPFYSGSAGNNVWWEYGKMYEMDAVTGKTIEVRYGGKEITPSVYGANGQLTKDSIL